MQGRLNDLGIKESMDVLFVHKAAGDGERSHADNLLKTLIDGQSDEIMYDCRKKRVMSTKATTAGANAQTRVFIEFMKNIGLLGSFLAVLSINMILMKHNEMLNE